MYVNYEFQNKNETVLIVGTYDSTPDTVNVNVKELEIKK